MVLSIFHFLLNSQCAIFLRVHVSFFFVRLILLIFCLFNHIFLSFHLRHFQFKYFIISIFKISNSQSLSLFTSQFNSLNLSINRYKRLKFIISRHIQTSSRSFTKSIRRLHVKKSSKPRGGGHLGKNR